MQAVQCAALSLTRLANLGRCYSSEAPYGLPGTALYLVPTPIGHHQDITYRAVRVLGAVDAVLAEDTRTAQRLLARYGIHTPLVQYHNANEHRTVSQLVKRMMTGQTLALVSDAGTPCVSDPGVKLVYGFACILHAATRSQQHRQPQVQLRQLACCMQGFYQGQGGRTVRCACVV